MPTYELSKHALAGSSAMPLAGVLTGCVSACVRVPVSVIKSRVQLGLYSGPSAALRATLCTVGVRGLYVGFGYASQLPPTSRAWPQIWSRPTARTTIVSPLEVRV
jgi:hypothetical protein